MSDVRAPAGCRHAGAVGRPCGNAGPRCAVPRWAPGVRGGEAGPRLPSQNGGPDFPTSLFLCLERSRRRGGGGSGSGGAWRGRSEDRAGILPSERPLLQLSLSGFNCKGRVVTFELPTRYGRGGWVIGPSFFPSLAAERETANKMGNKINGMSLAGE